MTMITSIHFQSPATYKFLSSIFGLPCTTQMFSRLRSSFPDVGICPKVMKNLRQKFAASTELEKYCVTSFDGMKIDQCLQLLKGDRISGFEEVGYNLRTNSLASELILFMVRGLTTPWKQVIGWNRR